MPVLEILKVENKEVGVIVRHDKPNGERCGCVAYFDWAKDCQRWTIVQNNPLTLSPSVVCPKCGLHGFIENGVWKG